MISGNSIVKALTGGSPEEDKGKAASHVMTKMREKVENLILLTRRKFS
jgi:hypothetical protein